MAQNEAALSVDRAATRQFRMVYKCNGRTCEITFTNNDDIGKGSDKELYKIFMTWAKLCTHQRVVNSSLKTKIVKALQGNEAAEKWLKARLAAYFVRHHSPEKSNTLVVEDLKGERLEQYARTLEDNSDTWVVRKLGCLTFLTPERAMAV